jgi:hypothetical protein
MWGAATGRRQPLLLPELIDEVDDLPQSLEVHQGQVGPAWSLRESLRPAVISPAHGNRRVRTVAKTDHQVRIDTLADTDNGTALTTEGVMGMGDRDIFPRGLGYRGSVLWVFLR